MRRELKYLVSERNREALRDRLAPALKPDPHASGRVPSYTVRSVYYDTPGLRDFTEKLSGDMIRRKVRVRAYDQPDGGPVFLEIKRKHGSAVWKDRAALDAEVVESILSGSPIPDLPARPRLAADRFVYRLRAERRQPVLLVAYDREPLIGRHDPSLRITFDRHLRVTAFPRGNPMLPSLYREPLNLVLPGQFILEIKFDRVYPSWFRPIQAEFGLKRQALSKYGMGIELLQSRTPWRFGRSAVSALAR